VADARRVLITGIAGQLAGLVARALEQRSDIAAIVEALKAGRIEFRADKTGVVHAPIGKASFAPEQLAENYTALRQALDAAKPDAAKGTYVRTVHLTSTMGPSVRVAI